MKRAAEDELIEYLTTEQDCVTAMDLRKQEEKEYLRELDRRDGVVDEFDDDFTSDGLFAAIDNPTQRMILRASLMGGQNDDDDPFGIRTYNTDDDLVPSGVGLFDHYTFD